MTNDDKRNEQSHSPQIDELNDLIAKAAALPGVATVMETYQRNAAYLEQLGQYSQRARVVSSLTSDSTGW